MKKRLLSALLALCLALALLPAAAFAADTSGTCGDNVTWSLSGGVLTISGTGEMEDVSYYGYTPWYDESSQITTVIIENGVTSIGDKAFYNCRNLTGVTIPSSVTTIGDYAFYNCKGLTGVTIPNSVTDLGDYAFYGCSGLTGVTIPGSVTSIGANAFAYCLDLTGVTIPDSVTTIGDYAFINCQSLTSVTVNGAPSFGSRIFDGTPWQKSLGDLVIINGILLSYQGNGGDVIIPESVTAIGNSAFYVRTDLTGVTIPNSVTSIGDYAFYGCTGLTGVTVPGSVTSIGYGAFASCTGLIGLTISDGVTSIGYGAFASCTDLTGLTVPGSVTSMGDYAFAYCIGLTGLTISDGAASIGEYAFSYCIGLKSVTIPGSVISIGNAAFANCIGLTDVTISDGVVSIGDFAFDECVSLADVTIPGSVTSIGGSAFFNCTSLTEVTIPGSVTSFGSGVFWYCTSLTRVTFSDGAASISKNGFQGCTALEEIVNCPDEEFNKRQAAHRAILDGWSNPGQYVRAQSERITAQANEITAGLTSDYEKAEAIVAWVSKNIKYRTFIGVAISPVAVLDNRFTDCDGYANLTTALLQAVGIPARNVYGPADGSGGWGNHAWNMAFVDGRWIWIDTTWISTGSTMYFDCGTAFLALKHNPTSRFTASAENTPSVWAQDEVWEAICKGLVPNDLQAAYRDDMTREEFCRLMVRLLEKSTGQNIDAYLASKGLTAQEPFTDTDSADVAAAYVLGIVDGTSKTTFKPGGSITRQEAATMLARTAKVLGLTAGDSKSFADEGQFASWASESIAFVSSLTDPATGVKVMDGTGNGKFSPSAIFSREQGILTALRLFHCAA